LKGVEGLEGGFCEVGNGTMEMGKIVMELEGDGVIRRVEKGTGESVGQLSLTTRVDVIIRSAEYWTRFTWVRCSIPLLRARTDRGGFKHDEAAVIHVS